MEAARGKGRLMLFVGSSLILIFGLVAAFTPGLAYTTVDTIYKTPPETLVHFYPFELGIHMFTLKLVLCAIGGAIGLFSLKENDRMVFI